MRLQAPGSRLQIVVGGAGRQPASSLGRRRAVFIAYSDTSASGSAMMASPHRSSATVLRLAPVETPRSRPQRPSFIDRSASGLLSPEPGAWSLEPAARSGA